MSLFKATINHSVTMNGVNLEKEMSVEIVTKIASNPLSYNSGYDVSNAFLRKYGIDIRKANAVSSSYIEVVKLS
jgi:hypothetical protein